MGKASRKKRQKESRAELVLEQKTAESEKPSTKTKLFSKPYLHFFLIIIIGLIIYSNTFNVPFHFDDTTNIVENYKLRDLNNFWPPSESRWFGFLTFALNYNFGGLDTVGYHIVNLIIHILNAILVYYLVILTLRTPYFLPPLNSPLTKGRCRGVNLIAIFSALLFVAHPIQTQAVTYIVQRFTSLATMFYLLSLVMYVKFRIQDTGYRMQDIENRESCILNHASGPQTLKPHATRYTLYAVSLISAILAMKTKEISFTLPFIIVCYEFFFFKSQNYELQTMNLRRLLYLMPFLLTLLIIPLSMIGIDKPTGDAIGELREAAQETEQISRGIYLLTQFSVIVTYIRLLFLPINQNLDYDYPIYNSFFEPNVFLSFLFLLLIFGLGVYLFYRSWSIPYRSLTCHPEPKAKGLRDSSATPQTCPERDDEILPLNQVQGQNDRKRRDDIKISTRYSLHPTRLIAFGIFWFFITLSVESSIIPIRDVIFEHRLYLPSVGIIIAFNTAIFYILNLIIRRLQSPNSELRTIFTIFPLTTAYSLLTAAVVVLSIATYQRNIVWQDEITLWEDVVRKSPNKARGYNNLGNAYMDKDDLKTAVREFQTALELNPYYADAHYSIGVAYHKLGLLDDAIEQFKSSLVLNPRFVEAYNDMGAVYARKGLLDRAVICFRKALEIDPLHAMARKNLDKALYLINKEGGQHRSPS